MTKYERKIFELVTASRSHMTADQVFQALREFYPSVALATIYNNLNKLCSAGLIRRISQEGAPDRYDRTERHDHLICRSCGRLLDVKLPDLTRQLQSQLDVPILAYDLKLIYLCEDCRRRKREKAGLS